MKRTRATYVICLLLTALPFILKFRENMSNTRFREICKSVHIFVKLKYFAKQIILFGISRSDALKLYLICPHSKSLLFFSISKWPKFDTNRQLRKRWRTRGGVTLMYLYHDPLRHYLSYLESYINDALIHKFASNSFWEHAQLISKLYDLK